MTERGYRGCSCKREEHGRKLKGRRQGEIVAGGRITGGQKKRSQKKVGGRETVSNDTKSDGGKKKEGAEEDVPAPAATSFTSCDLCFSLSYQVCLCVLKSVCVWEQ